MTGSKIHKSWNLEFWAFKIMKSWFDCTNLEQINSRKLLNLLFNHISPINDPTMTIIIPIVFLWFFYDLLMIFPGSCIGYPPQAWLRLYQEYTAVHYRTMQLYTGRCWDFICQPPRQIATQPVNQKRARRQPSPAQHSQGHFICLAHGFANTIDSCVVYFVRLYLICRRCRARCFSGIDYNSLRMSRA